MFKRLDAADVDVAMLALKLSFAAQTLDVSFWTDAKVLVVAQEKLQLVGQVGEILVIWSSGKQQGFAIQFMNQFLDVVISLSAAVAQVMAFVYDNQSVVPGVLHINGFLHRDDVCFEIVFLFVFSPHVLQVGWTDDEGAAGVGHLVDFGDGAGGDGLSQTHHIAYHGSVSLVVVKMLGCNLHRILLEIEKGVAEFGRKRKLLDARTCFLTEMIHRLEINIIRWNIFFACPTVVNGIYQFAGDVDAELVVPSCIKPF